MDTKTEIEEAKRTHMKQFHIEHLKEMEKILKNELEGNWNEPKHRKKKLALKGINMKSVPSHQLN